MTGKKLLRIQIIISLLSTLLVTGAVSLCYQAGMLSRFDNFLFDLNIKWRGPVPTSDRITLVLMDEESAARLKRYRGQWSRRKMATALKNVCGAGASVVGLDMVMSAPDLDPEADRILAGVIGECNNVVLARVSAAQGVGEISPLGKFQEAMIGDGFIDVPLDKDGILRRIRFLNAKPMPDGGLQLLPSFALELARTFLDLEFDFDFSSEDHFLLGRADGKNISLPYPDLLINYYGDYTAFTVVSFADAVSNRIREADIKDRVILFGSSLSSQKDFFTTPYSRFHQKDDTLTERFEAVDEGILGSDEPGVACHAHAVETILNQAFIKHINGSPVLLLTIVLALLGMLFYLPKIGMLVETGILFLLLATVVGSSHQLFIKNRLWLDIAPLLGVFMLQFVAGVTLQKSFGRKKNAMITSMFGKYVSAGVVNELIGGDISTTLEGSRKKLTMLFSDLRNFTTISERLGARDTGRLLNEYFDAMIPLVFANKGTLDKLMGDAIMAFYGAPMSVQDHPSRAAATALMMVEKLRELKLREDVVGTKDLDVGIGLNTGDVTVGNLGSNEFMDYTIIGDAVNLASRLEGLNKFYGTQILCSEFTADELDERFLVRELDMVKVKGKEKAVRIYELAGWRDQQSRKRLAMFSLFEKGLAFYRQQKWDEAENLFKQLALSSGDDRPTLLYLERIANFRKNPPLSGWQGVTSFEHK